MTITNDERREISAKLRETEGMHKFVEIVGISWEDKSWCWHDVAMKYADLIEPEQEHTCKVVREDVDIDGSRTTDYSCGCFNNEGWNHNYCPNCGAKVLK